MNWPAVSATGKSKNVANEKASILNGKTWILELCVHFLNPCQRICRIRRQSLNLQKTMLCTVHVRMRSPLDNYRFFNYWHSNWQVYLILTSFASFLRKCKQTYNLSATSAWLYVKKTPGRTFWMIKAARQQARCTRVGLSAIKSCFRVNNSDIQIWVLHFSVQPLLFKFAWHRPQLSTCQAQVCKCIHTPWVCAIHFVHVDVKLIRRSETANIH